MSEAGRRAQSRWVDVAFAASAIWWAIAPLASGDATWSAPVRLAIAALHLEAAALFLFRDDVFTPSRPGELLMAIPSLVCGGLAFSQAPSPDIWPTDAIVLFLIAAAWTFFSLATLGKSFAILPAVRRCVTRGPYRLVRHPIYLGEGAMVAACVLAARGSSWWVFLLFVMTTAARVVVEERALARSSDAWNLYAQSVRWRIIPGVI